MTRTPSPKENADLAAHIDMHDHTTNHGLAIEATFARSPHQAYPQVAATI